MDHPLKGCFVRVSHAKALLGAFQRYISEAPSELNVDPPGASWIEPKVDLKRNVLNLCAALDLDLPLSFGIVFGDANHNLHAALDNLAYELGRLSGKNPGYDSAFPILNHANEWFQESTLRALSFIGPHERALIESHQPFMERNGVEARHQILARIKRYSNESKHRVVSPIAAIGTGFDVHSIDAPTLRILGQHDLVEKAFRKGAVMASFDIEVIGEFDGKVNMKGELPWYPAIEHERAEFFLVSAHAYVHDLLIEFADAFFDGVPDFVRHEGTP